jgi:single-stranded DNA-binding protein
MAITITGKLNKDASVFAAGQDSSGFGLRVGVQYYDRETKQKEWTNYEAAAFAKNGPQADFYKQSLVAGSIVELTGTHAKIRTFDGQNGQVLSIELIDAKIGYIGTVGNAAPNNAQNSGNQQYGAQQRQPAQQQNAASKMYGDKPAQRPAPQPQSQNPTPDLDAGWDDDIPF